MNKISSGNRIRYFLLFIPFRLYLVFFLIGIFIAYLWLQAQHTYVESSFTAILTLLSKAFLWFGAALLTLSLLTVLIPWIIFIIKKKNSRIQVTIDMAAKETEGIATQPVKIKINPLLRPPFGFLHYRFVYDNQKLSLKFSMIPQKQKLRFFTAAQEGVYNWPLQEIKEYNVEKIIIYFEDLFQFFSFSTAVRTKDTFFIKPAKKEVDELRVAPKKTEEENTRIEELRRVEGEYLNYKNFEDNDDVRRIVWKIYAKNKELVVRIPEILDPFASHIYLYASYLDGLDAADQPMIAQHGLNYFKTSVWSIYKRLQQQGFDVRYIPDQEIKQGSTPDNDQKVQYNISLSNWHSSGTLQEYIRPKIASVVCVSSLTTVSQINDLISVVSKDTFIIFIKLSNSLKKQGITKWIRWIFLQEEKEKNNRYLMQWNMSGDKRKILQNERAIQQVLQHTDAQTITI